MDQEKPQSGKAKSDWWKPGITIFVQVSAWIAAPILLALFVGKWLDDKYGTEPWLFLGLTALAFVISSVGIIKVTLDYTKKIEKEAQEKKRSQDNLTQDNNK